MIFFGAKALDAVLFDLDGTLIHSHIDFDLMCSEMIRLAQAAGVPEQSLSGKEILEMVDAAASFLPSERASILRREMWMRLEEIERDGCTGSQPIVGAVDLLGTLRDSGTKIGIVTRNCRAVSKPLVDELGLAYDVLLTRDDVARCKPNPAHLRDALAALDTDADQSLMVGDHWLDVRVGRDAGCAATLGVLGERSVDWFAPCPPDAVVRDLREAMALFHD